MNDTVAFAGSRECDYTLIPDVVQSVLRSGRRISVGCCVGCDSIVLSSLLKEQGTCYAAFGENGEGSCPVSAVSMVNQFASEGGEVVYWAGGGQSVPLNRRLSNRTVAVATSATTACVVFFSSPHSIGTFLAARTASRRSVPVYAFPIGFDGCHLPKLGYGGWLPVEKKGAWSKAFLWKPITALA